MEKFFFFIAVLFALVICGNAQNTFPATGAVGIGTASPNAASLLDVKSTNKGVLIPRMTQLQRNAIASPPVGLLIFQTDVIPAFYWYTGSGWKSVNGAARDLANLVSTTSVNASLLPNATGLKDIGSSLKKWKNGYFSGTVNASKVSASTSGTAVYGNSTGGGYGVWGNSSYLGVYGTGKGYGVYGDGGSFGVHGRGGIFGVSGYSDKYGVYGSSLNGYGVTGVSTSGYGVYGESNSNYGVYGKSDYTGVYGAGENYGVFGYSSDNYGLYGNGGYVGTYGTSTTFGTYGYSANGYGTTGATSAGIGVYGSASGSGGYAGYFSSANYRGIYVESSPNSITGYFNGDIYTTGAYTSSDILLKKNFKAVSNAMEIINRLKPMNYEFKNDGNYIQLNLPKGNHYGLIAQDVEKVLPGLVREANHEITERLIAGKEPPKSTEQAEKKETLSFKAINYTELIPIIVKGMQEQEVKIQEQQKQIDELKSLVQTLSKKEHITTELSIAFLKQNSPNPFHNNTIISYYIPDNAGYAQIKITDVEGSIIKVFNAAKGQGKINIRSGELPAGTYNYTLYINNKTIDTRQMVLEK